MRSGLRCNRMTVQYCLHCGLEFKAIKNNGKKQIYCSVSCQRKSSNQRNKEVNRIKETQFRNELSDRVVKRNIYIGSKGRIAYDQITPEMIAEKRKHILEWRNREKKPKIKKSYYCRVCGQQLNSYGVYCSSECEKKYNCEQSYLRNKPKKALRERSCKECGRVFTPEYGDKRKGFCSKECSKKYSKRKYRKEYGVNHRQRARHFGCGYEHVKITQVFERDKWHCQICHIKTPKNLKGTIKDNAPELDHIIPLSKGGEHSYRNTQCACRKCNIEKSNNIIGQIRLFG